MLKARIIPCLDVKDGGVVKGVNFVDLRDAGDPVEAARAYDAAGADELCFLDITARHVAPPLIFTLSLRHSAQYTLPLPVVPLLMLHYVLCQLRHSGASTVSIHPT